MVEHFPTNAHKKSYVRGRKKNLFVPSNKQETTLILGGIRVNVKESFGGNENSVQVPTVPRRKIASSPERIGRPPERVSRNPKAGMKYTVWLEEVPSENSLYPTNFKTGMRFLSKKGKEFKERAVKSFFEADLPKFPTKELVVELVAYWRNMRRADMMNYHKAIADALKAGNFIEDDWIVLMRDQQFFYPDNPNRTIPKGVQGFLLTIYELNS